MGHVGQEGTLLLARVLGVLCLTLKPFLHLHQMSDVTHHTEMSCETSLLVVDGHASDDIPARLVADGCIGEMVNHGEVVVMIRIVVHELARSLFLVPTKRIDVIIEGDGYVYLAQSCGEGDGAGVYVAGPDKHFAVGEQIVQFVFVSGDLLVGFGQLLDMLSLAQIHLTLFCDVAC